ncbi:MAG: hypothetical protein ACYTAS_15145, partial [Planctomycetota bacterium]
MKRALFAAVVVLVLLTGSAWVRAAVLNVPSDYPTIQEAIDASSDGDTVLVAPGLYFERINYNGKNIVVTSTDPNDPRVVGYTVINAEGEGSVVTFENGETPEAVLTGFTITGGAGTMGNSSDWYQYYYGGGIYCRRGSPTITRNVITNNVVPYSEELVEEVIGGITYRQYHYEWSDGGGIFCGSGATISHNIIYNNSAETGGGIRTGYCTVSNNIIYDNSAVYGGGVYTYGGWLLNNTIVGNDASLEPETTGRGGNVYASFPYDYAGLTIASNIIANAKSGGGLFWQNAGGEAIRFNNVWGNQPSEYGMQDPRTNDLIFSEAADWTGRNGNISVDPVFSTLWSERQHLQAESPCVSAGDPNFVPAPGETDIDGDPRVFAKRVDIGADERIGYVKPLADAGQDHHIL